MVEGGGRSRVLDVGVCVTIAGEQCEYTRDEIACFETD